MTVLDWLLDSDPAVRWQVLRDLTDAPPEVVAAERARVATAGWDARLLVLRDTIDLVRRNCRWEHEGQEFFDGEVEPCINGRTVAIGSYFGMDVDDIVERLVGEQLPDGGWNCEAERGSVRSFTLRALRVLRWFDAGG